MHFRLRPDVEQRFDRGTSAQETAAAHDRTTGDAGTPAPNQLFITFNNVTGTATPTTFFAYGHEHADLRIFGGTSTAITRRDIAFDNDNLVYDEFFAWKLVVDGDRCGMTVIVTSPGTGDSEVVTLTGSAPYFSGTLTLSSTVGVGNNNGTLFVLPTETLNATYNDTSPIGSSSAPRA